ncbi:MAG: XRE family transcriptional regulator [Chloroflexi bacterium]|nr:MAG: XRE family transcriptional regulator [Chloroflexota bacterium]
MPLDWRLKLWLATERGIFRPSELQARLAEKAGVQLSNQAVSALINGQPNALRIQTIQALCNALDCKLSDFCDVLPDPPAPLGKKRKATSPTRLYGGKNVSNAEDAASIYPDPHEVQQRKKSSRGKG